MEEAAVRLSWLELFGLAFALTCVLYALHEKRKAQMSIPPRPSEWVTDTSGVLTNTFIQAQRDKLEGWYQQTGHRLLVYVVPSKTESTQSYDVYTTIYFDAWGVGRTAGTQQFPLTHDGVVLFIFTQDDMRWIRVGWGLLDAIPDSEATRICVDVIKPLVHLNQWEAAVNAGINAITADIDTWDASH